MTQPACGERACGEPACGEEVCGERGSPGCSVRGVAIKANPTGMTRAGNDLRGGTGDGPRRRHRRRGLGLLGAVVVVAGLLATGCSQAINVETLENELASQIAVQRGVGVSAVKVVCPATVEVDAGSVVDCSAVIDGQPFTVTVTQTDGEGAMEWILSTGETEQVPSTETSISPEGTDQGS